MYAFIPNPFAILFAAIALFLVTPIIHGVSNRVFHRLGFEGLSKPKYLKLTAISFVTWVAVLMLPWPIGPFLGLLLIWLTGYFVHVTKEFRQRNGTRAAAIALYITICVLFGISLLLTVYFVVPRSF
jgi:lauroyl/myristoyl acyltransferase